MQTWFISHFSCKSVDFYLEELMYFFFPLPPTPICLRGQTVTGMHSSTQKKKGGLEWRREVCSFLTPCMGSSCKFRPCCSYILLQREVFTTLPHSLLCKKYQSLRLNGDCRLIQKGLCTVVADRSRGLGLMV